MNKEKSDAPANEDGDMGASRAGHAEFVVIKTPLLRARLGTIMLLRRGRPHHQPRSHYVAFQTAEGALSRHFVRRDPAMIAELRPPPDPVPA